MTESIQVNGHTVLLVRTSADCPLEKASYECFSCRHTTAVGFCWHPIDAYDETQRGVHVGPHKDTPWPELLKDYQLRHDAALLRKMR